MATFNGCPGAAGINRTPSLDIKKCPECGEEIELFSNETHTYCTRCGFTAYNDKQNCITWCKYAIDCVGEDVYNRFMAAQEEIARLKEAEAATQQVAE